MRGILGAFGSCVAIFAIVMGVVAFNQYRAVEDWGNTSIETSGGDPRVPDVVIAAHPLLGNALNDSLGDIQQLVIYAVLQPGDLLPAGTSSRSCWAAAEKVWLPPLVDRFEKRCEDVAATEAKASKLIVDGAIRLVVARRCEGDLDSPATLADALPQGLVKAQREAIARIDARIAEGCRSKATAGGGDLDSLTA